MTSRRIKCGLQACATDNDGVHTATPIGDFLDFNHKATHCAVCECSKCDRSLCVLSNPNAFNWCRHNFAVTIRTIVLWVLWLTAFLLNPVRTPSDITGIYVEYIKHALHFLLFLLFRDHRASAVRCSKYEDFDFWLPLIIDVLNTLF